MTIISNDWISPKAEIKISKLGGKGLFAKSIINEGEKVVVWRGEYTNKKGSKLAQQNGKLVMQWDEDLFSVEDRGSDEGYFVNHSCDSNLWMKDTYTLIAKRNINVSEEITADYVLWEADKNYISKWDCNCGSKLCRKKVTGKDWQNIDIQDRYKNHFSPLINKRIEKNRCI